MSCVELLFYSEPLKYLRNIDVEMLISLPVSDVKIGLRLVMICLRNNRRLSYSFNLPAYCTYLDISADHLCAICNT